jgi:hypothetical protein
MKFRTRVLLAGKTATGIVVPTDVVAGLGSGKRPAVKVTLNGYKYRSTVASMRGEFMLPVSADVRDRSGVAAGDDVDVVLELDTEAREVAVPADLKAALAADPDALRFFDGLSYSNKQRVVLPIEAAKAPDTRQRRVEKAISLLRQGRA